VVIEAAKAGEPVAGDVTVRAARALAALAATCARRLGVTGAIDVALSGGTFASEWFRALTAEQIALALPAARVVASHTDPAGGALLLAYTYKEGEQG